MEMNPTKIYRLSGKTFILATTQEVKVGDYVIHITDNPPTYVGEVKSLPNPGLANVEWFKWANETYHSYEACGLLVRLEEWK